MASINIKGRRSGDTDKWMSLPQIMREGKIGILAVQETHLTDELADQFENLFGNSLLLRFSPDPTTRNARGVAVVVNKRLVKTQGIEETVIIPGRAMVVRVPWHDDQHVNVLAIYAPNIPREITEFWKTIQDKIDTSPNLKPDVLMGDFNLVEDAIDRIPSKTDDQRATGALREFIIKHNLIDGWRTANPDEKGYTWSRDSDGTQSRIDRIYVQEDYFRECSGWNIEPAPIPTDHELISASISTPSTPELGRGRWAIPMRCLKRREVKKEVQRKALELQMGIENLSERTPLNNPQTMLKNFKEAVRETVRKHDRKFQPIIKSKIAKLTEQLQATLNDPALPDDEKRLTATHLKKEIRLLQKETHQNNRDLQTAIDAAEGEQIGKTWSNRHKESKPRDTIKCLKDPATNEPTRNSQRMAKIAAKYHEDLQSDGHDPSAAPERGTLDEILRCVEAKTSNESKRELTKSITEDEVRNAIQKTIKEKAPGLDGIPIEMWKSLDDQFQATTNNPSAERRSNIIWVLTQVFQDIEKYGVAESTDFHEGCMCPIYKKKDPDNVANYCPITLLNTDYKIFTKALSLKLASVAGEVIHEDQAGFIRGRSIFNQIKTTKLVTDYMERTQKAGAIVALDQEKAYDKILHPYLWAVLEKLEIPESFIRIIKALYDNAKTRVLINGELSEPFTITRGVRQGDALSCLLFDIAIEPLAENIRKSQEITGIQIPGRRDFLKVTMFADDTSTYLSKNDRIEDLQAILMKWCSVSGAKFNIEKTEIIPLGSREQRREIMNSRKLNAGHAEPIPADIHIARDGEPVRILGAWIGNEIDQAATWAPIVEDCCKRLKRWGAAKHSLEGCRLIVQMQIGGVTQFLTKVQGMPREVETELNKQIRRFMWNNEKSDTVNQAQMYAKHKKGGKKVLDLEARNKAIHLTWLKAYLNLDSKRATWTYFADAMLKDDIPPSHKIDQDPQSRIMPIVQEWDTRSKGSTLPEDLRMMLKLAKECNVQLAATTPTREVQEALPIWYHARSAPSVRKLYKTRTAKCLRRKHGMKLVRDAMTTLGLATDEHAPDNSCVCEGCKKMRANEKCTHPHDCLMLAAELLKKIYPKWNPTKERMQPVTVHEERSDPEEEGTTFNRDNETDELKDAITIFGETMAEPTDITKTAPRREGVIPRETTAYTDGACIDNGSENAKAGSGVWYGDNDPRNSSTRVAYKEQSNQTGELVAVLLAVRNHPPDEDLRIISDSRYVIDGLTKNIKQWERRDWLNVENKDIFKCITAWMRWRSGKTTLQWVKGHNGTKGNEEADKLASEGAKKPMPTTELDLNPPYNQLTSGAKLSSLEQRDFYQVLREKRRIPPRSGAERNVGTIKACAQDTFGSNPTTEKVWEATRHKDLTRKTRDFLWKSTQNAYKIGSYWNPIEGFEQRGICPLCEEQEDMNHILVDCTARPREQAWELANKVWGNRNETPLPSRLGDILGCGLASFKRGNRPDRGKNRLYRILVSETAYLIWKMRNERRIRDHEATDSEVRNRWTKAINKRLTIDRALTNSTRFGKRALDKKLVKSTWRNCLNREEELPENWTSIMGVLVGISTSRPPGRGDEESHTAPRAASA